MSHISSGMAPAPQTIVPIVGPPGEQHRGTGPVVIIKLDNPLTPQTATVAVRDKSPFESPYLVPAGMGPFTLGNVNTTCTTAVPTGGGSVTVTPASMQNVQVGDVVLCVNSDNSGAEYVQITALTSTTWTATFTSAKTGTWTIKSGVYTYDNSSGLGGSIMHANLDSHVILGGPYGYSTTAPTPYYAAIADHKHDGNLNSGGFVNPQPIDITQLSSNPNPQSPPILVGILPVFTYENVGATAFDLHFDISLSITNPEWLYAIDFLAVNHGQPPPTTHSAIWASRRPNDTGVYTDVFLLAMTAGIPGGWDVYCGFKDVSGDLSAVTFIGTTASNPFSSTNSNFPAMPSGAFFTATVITPSVFDGGMHKLIGNAANSLLHPVLLASFTMGDTNNPPSPNWASSWVPYLRQHTTSTPTNKTTYARLPPIKQTSSSFGNGTAQQIIYGSVTPGQTYDLAAALMDQAGNETALVQLVSNYSVGNPNLPNCPFPGGYIQPDGSISNVNGAVSNQTLAIAAGAYGTFLHSVADIATPDASQAVGLLIGNSESPVANGYYITVQPGLSTTTVYLYKYVNGTATQLNNSAVPIFDTNYHNFALTVTINNGNHVIEATFDSLTVLTSVVTSGFPTMGPFAAQIYTGTSTGTVRNFKFTEQTSHFSQLPTPVKPIVIPPWVTNPGDGSPLSGGLITGRHFHGGNSADTGDVVDNTGKVLHTRHSPGVQSSIDSTGNILNVAFPGGKLQSDGSLTSVDGQYDKRNWAMVSGTVFHAEGTFTSGGTGSLEIYLDDGTGSNGYFCAWNVSSGLFQVGKNVSGSASEIAGQTYTNPVAGNTKFVLRLTVTAGSSNTIEASLNDVHLALQSDSAVTLIGKNVRVAVDTAGASGSLYNWSVYTGLGHYSTLPTPVKGVINGDGSSGKTTDWLPESGTNKYAAEHGADITENHTSNDTSNVNGVASTDYSGTFESNGSGKVRFKSSAAFKDKIPNSIANLTSNIEVQFYSASAGSLVAWITSNIPTSKSPGGTNQPDWEYPDGGGIFPGSTNGYSTVNGTSQTAPAKYWNGSSAVSMSWTGLGTSGVYILIGYNPSLDYYTIPYGPTSTAPTDDVVAAAQGDGSVLVALISASSGTIIHTGGGGGQPIGGGGGRQRE